MNFKREKSVPLAHILRGRCILTIYWILVALIMILLANVEASPGDRLPEFRKCVQSCIESNCSNNDIHGEWVAHKKLLNRVLGWTCISECDYTCQHDITLVRSSQHLPGVQFHGKWPFYRVLGMQEFFSVLFSWFNFMAHVNGLKRLRRNLPYTYSMNKFYQCFAYFGLTCWLFSMIFHTRDVSITEKLDYFAAGANVLYGLYFAPVRIFRLDRTEYHINIIRRFWTVLCVCMFAGHVTYLTVWRWDYSYNMFSNVCVGIVTNVLWIMFSTRRFLGCREKWTLMPIFIIVWLSFAMSLELFDFPPWFGLIDAHSLWHLGTVPPIIWWYSFLIRDAQADIRNQFRIKQ